MRFMLYALDEKIWVINYAENFLSTEDHLILGGISRIPEILFLYTERKKYLKDGKYLFDGY